MSKKVRELTPAVLEELEKESRELREEFRKRIQKMWDIPPDQLHTPTK